MAGVQLDSDQIVALNKLKSGCILNGDTGSGKSRVSLAYYYKLYGGQLNTNTYIRMIQPCDLYIITTAKKRDDLEWESELIHFYMSTDPNLNIYHNKIVVDSWNNITKYKDVKHSFFIFDEQRLVGSGVWVKTFYQIAKWNRWILLTATPGDTWSDYVPVFVANGFFKNKSDFDRQHAIYSRYVNFPRIDRYINEGPLIKYRNQILIYMEFKRKTIQHHEIVICEYDRYNYEYIEKHRMNIYTNEPIQNANEYCMCLRRLVNSDVSRQNAILEILKKHSKIIIFYNYDYELDILRKLLDGVYPYTEWNGHKHQKLLDGDKWIYLVQYKAGNEGWNCITCDTIIYYSQNYSYKIMKQSAGRIDRRNNTYVDLYYYHLKSNSRIDKTINMALNRKKKFNESAYYNKIALNNERRN